VTKTDQRSSDEKQGSVAGYSNKAFAQAGIRPDASAPRACSAEVLRDAAAGNLEDAADVQRHVMNSERRRRLALATTLHRHPQRDRRWPASVS